MRCLDRLSNTHCRSGDGCPCCRGGTAKVSIHTQFAGGSFGRRAVPNSDFVLDAALIAKASGLDVPINLQWSREDDMKGGYYRPMTLQKLSASIDKNGELSGCIKRWCLNHYYAARRLKACTGAVGYDHD